MERENRRGQILLRRKMRNNAQLKLRKLQFIDGEYELHTLESWEVLTEYSGCDVVFLCYILLWKGKSRSSEVEASRVAKLPKVCKAGSDSHWLQ